MDVNLEKQESRLVTKGDRKTIEKFIDILEKE